MDPKEMTDKVLQGRSSIPGAMLWMFGLSLLLTLLLGWIPLVGPFIGPVVGGYIGGRRAGSAGRAFLAAIIPGVLLSLSIFGLGSLAAALSSIPLLGAAAALVAGLVGFLFFLSTFLLFLSALIGGFLGGRQTG